MIRPFAAVLLAFLAALVMTGAPCARALGEGVPRQARPVLEHDLKTPARRQLDILAKEIMGMSEAEALALVPVQTPFITSDCPACGNGHFARGLERGLWKLALPGSPK
jgi:hypothetical protein